MSKGEDTVAAILDSTGVQYIRQYTIPGLKDKRLLRFDFYLPDYLACIEYNGKQHYKANDYFGGEKGLKDLQRRDKLKKQFCKDNGVKLVVVHYTGSERKIENRLYTTLRIGMYRKRNTKAAIPWYEKRTKKAVIPWYEKQGLKMVYDPQLKCDVLIPDDHQK